MHSTSYVQLLIGIKLIGNHLCLPGIWVHFRMTSYFSGHITRLNCGHHPILIPRDKTKTANIATLYPIYHRFRHGSYFKQLSLWSCRRPFTLHISKVCSRVFVRYNGGLLGVRRRTIQREKLRWKWKRLGRIKEKWGREPRVLFNSSKTKSNVWGKWLKPLDHQTC